MEVIIQSSAEKACRLGARIIASVIRKKKFPVLGLATGSTPLSLYNELVKMHQESGLSFEQVTTFNLDEYVGLKENHPASFRTYMFQNFFHHININPESIHIPDGNSPDIPASCQAYEAEIKKAGGIDLQVLGIGQDGHLAFNEPSSSLASGTRLKTLTQVTRKANAAPFGGFENVPLHVITMGLGTIMDSRSCLLLAFGEKKAEAVKAMVEGPVSAACPASLLQFHEKAIVLLDPEAASLLNRRDYYQEVYAGKPDWQRWE